MLQQFGRPREDYVAVLTLREFLADMTLLSCFIPVPLREFT
jgi:hypothetical protein